VGTGGARFAGPPPALNVSLGRLLLLFVASRLLYLMLIDPSYLSPQLGDELYVGTIAQELVTGLKLPFAEYSGSNYMLGTLVMGALAAGFFLLFGPTVFDLKLASLLVFTLALAFWSASGWQGTSLCSSVSRRRCSLPTPWPRSVIMRILSCFLR